MISRMQIDFKKYNADGIGSPHDFTQGSLLSSATLGYQKYKPYRLDFPHIHLHTRVNDICKHHLPNEMR